MAPVNLCSHVWHVNHHLLSLRSTRACAAWTRQERWASPTGPRHAQPDWRAKTRIAIPGVARRARAGSRAAAWRLRHAAARATRIAIQGGHPLLRGEARICPNPPDHRARPAQTPPGRTGCPDEAHVFVTAALAAAQRHGPRRAPREPGPQPSTTFCSKLEQVPPDPTCHGLKPFFLFSQRTMAYAENDAMPTEAQCVVVGAGVAGSGMALGFLALCSSCAVSPRHLI